MNDVLETLAAAEASLETGFYDFHSWTDCTCGHIYKGALGHEGTETDVRFDMDGPYSQALAAVVDAYREEVDAFYEKYSDRSFRLPEAVSNLTITRSRREMRAARAVALELVRHTRETIEAAQREAMRDVARHAEMKYGDPIPAIPTTHATPAEARAAHRERPAELVG